MFGRIRLVTAALVSFVAVALVPGCLGQQARDGPGAQSLVLSGDGVVADARAGVGLLPEGDRTATAKAIDDFEQALAAGDRESIATVAWPNWSLVHAAAVAGIDGRETAGAIGPHVAASLRERLANFGNLLAKTAGPSP